MAARRRPGQPPDVDWEHAFHSLDSRLRQLQTNYNAKEEELKLLKVAVRKGTAPRTTTTQPAEAASPRGRPATRPQQQQPRGNAPGSERGVQSRFEQQMWDALSSSTLSTTLSSHREWGTVAPADEKPVDRSVPLPVTGLPDPAMVWDGGVPNHTATAALFHQNQSLQRELQETSAKLTGLQLEMSSVRAAFLVKEAAVAELQEQVHHVVCERDRLSLEADGLKRLTTSLNGTVTNHTTELSALRTRLVAGADHNELQHRELHRLTEDLTKRTEEAAEARSQLALQAAALHSQRHTNENLLHEVRTLNEQLMDERRKVVSLSRQAQQQIIEDAKTEDLRAQIRTLQDDLRHVQDAHLHLMTEFTGVSESAMTEARDILKVELTEMREAAEHWEDVSKRMYKDMTLQTERHQLCREECEATKVARDRATAELERAKEELRLCYAKLEVAWPQHHRITSWLPADELERLLRATAAHQALKEEGLQGEENNGAPPVDVDTAFPTPPAAAAASTAEQLTIATPPPHPDEMLSFLPPDNTTAVEKIYELNEANAGLCATLEQLRASHDLLQQQLVLSGAERERAAAIVATVQQREEEGQDLLLEQMDRVSFLERQIQSMRGYAVPPYLPEPELEVGGSQNVIQLFLGQLVSYVARVGSETSYPLSTDLYFCSADFLLHETITTPSIVGLNGFLDTSAAYSIDMDVLLLYYLVTRDLEVQLHRMRSEEEVRRAEEAAAAAAAGGEEQQQQEDALEKMTDGLEYQYETVATGHISILGLVTSGSEGSLPELRTQVNLYHCVTNECVATVEVKVSAKIPFSKSFLDLAESGSSSWIKGSVVHNENLPLVGDGKGDPEVPHYTANKADQTVALSTTAENTDHMAASDATRVRHSDSHLQALIHQARTGVPPEPYAYFHRSSSSSTSSSRHYTAAAAGRGGSMHSVVHPCQLPARFVSRPMSPPHVAPEARSYASSAARYTPSPSPSPLYGQRGLYEAEQFLTIDVVRVDLNGELSPPLPRLSCFYELRGVGRSVHLAAPPTPRYSIQYLQQPHGTDFAITHPSQRMALQREPLTLFLLNEDEREEGDGKVWGVAVCDLEPFLTHPGGATKELSLPIMRYGHPLPHSCIHIRLVFNGEGTATAFNQQHEAGRIIPHLDLGASFTPPIPSPAAGSGGVLPDDHHPPFHMDTPPSPLYTARPKEAPHEVAHGSHTPTPVATKGMTATTYALEEDLLAFELQQHQRR